MVHYPKKEISKVHYGNEKLSRSGKFRLNVVLETRSGGRLDGNSGSEKWIQPHRLSLRWVLRVLEIKASWACNFLSKGLRESEDVS